VCMRTAKGLPFVATSYMKQIIEGILARVQRDHKVTLIDHLFMGNHPHILIEAGDRDQCKRFYGEVQKQLTEAIKRLTGRSHLNLWRRNSTSVVLYGDLAAVQKRIAYLYANPARANLVDSIEQYPGLSSFGAFEQAPLTLDAKVTKRCPWVQAPMIPRLPTLSVTPRQDRALTESMRIKATEHHDLTYHPHKWMRRFGITTPEGIAEVKAGILRILREFEEEARQRRAREGWKVMGAARLQRQALDIVNYKPSPSQRIFIYAVDPQTRIRMIEEYRLFCERCAECYEAWKRGDASVRWPPGAYPPAPPVNTNWFIG
jgi:hypothetical protein